jgi:hypothetical protein
MTSPTSELNELVRLSRILVERDGERLYSARNSPTILALRVLTDETLWIKRVRGRLMITRSLKKDNTRSCVYDNGLDGDDPTAGPWGPWLEPYLEELRQRLPLDALAAAGE